MAEHDGWSAGPTCLGMEHDVTKTVQHGVLVSILGCLSSTLKPSILIILILILIHTTASQHTNTLKDISPSDHNSLSKHHQTNSQDEGQLRCFHPLLPRRLHGREPHPPR